jgi:protein-tyrosine phosphatase
MQGLISYFKLLIITIERGVDHTVRILFGLPQLKKSMITPELYLGGQYNLTGYKKLKKLGITGIVNMRLHSIHTDIKGITDMHVLHLPTPDRTAPTLADLKKGVAFMQKEIENGGKVYVHCKWGEGRGPSMAIAYLLSTGLTLDDALALIKKVRTFISPNHMQLKRLKELENVYKK